MSNLFGVGGGARLQFDSGGNFLAIFVARHAIYSYIAYRGMSANKLLDLFRVNVFARSDNHVLDASCNADVAIAVYVGNIPGAQPSDARNRLLGGALVLVIPLHHMVPAGP